MSNVAIRVENVGKRYRRGSAAPYQRFSEILQRLPAAAVEAARGAFRAKSQTDDQSEFWALKDVSFDVKEGEVLGAIGRNGAGKSTLLKILSRITEPTTGRFGVRGRLASLLEVGTGFHPELTGRENIFLSGAILGMSRAEIKRRFDEIVAFAEIEEALDTPVKRYSSGMYVRLGFAIAAHLQPEILIVDEVLAVGDAAFQTKCLGKMGEVAKSGRTVLFVSHNMTAVNALCSSVAWIDHGAVRQIGPSGEVVAEYLQAQSFEESKNFSLSEKALSAGSLQILNAECSLPQAAMQPTRQTPFDVVLRCACEESNFYTITLLFYNDENVVAFGSSLAETEVGGGFVKKGIHDYRCHLPGGLLNAGRLRVKLLIVDRSLQVVLEEEGLLWINVIDDQVNALGWHGKRAGVVRPALDWTVDALSGVAS